MKLRAWKNKKALSTAITLSLLMGAYGVTEAAPSVYGCDMTSYSAKYLAADGSAVDTESGAAVVAGVNSDGAQTYVTSIFLYGQEVSGRKFEVKGGEWDSVYGVYYIDSYLGYGDKDSVFGNIVTISGGTVDNSVYGGCYVYSTSSYTADDKAVFNNTVNISGGKISGSVYGGYLYDRDASYSGSMGNVAVYNNTVNISGGNK